MAQLWGGRFQGALDKDASDFQNSISFDKRLYRQDIRGSFAQAQMLGDCGIVTKKESADMISGLTSILSDIESGELVISDECEDIHSFVEAELIKRVGDAGKKLHTGRSRNDQVALDLKMYIRDEILDIDDELYDLQKTILGIMNDNIDTFMPGFTHMQKAQPVTLAHHFGAYFEMIKRDRSRLKDTRSRLNECPLGSGALAGTTYPLDRNETAKLLGFDKPTDNSMDSVSDRDYLIEFLTDLSMIMMHLSRSCEEVITWNSNEYKFVEMDDRYSTGSSIMPQKKNPDIAELVRGKTGRVYGSLMAMLTTMKGIPLAYDKDLQEDKQVTFDAIDTVLGCLKLYNGMICTMKINKDTMERSASGGFTNATDAADYLVGKGIPFRDAHSVIGNIVLYCIEHGESLDDLTIAEWRSFSDKFDKDIYKAISIKECVERRTTHGAPGETSMKDVMGDYGQYLAEGTLRQMTEKRAN